MTDGTLRKGALMAFFTHAEECCFKSRAVSPGGCGEEGSVREDQVR